jgi:hypothetical protein
METIFPDLEVLLVARIKEGLEANPETVTTGVVVSVMKPEPGTPGYPARIVTVRSDGGIDVERGLTRSDRIGINVYAQKYKDANDLARIVDSIVRSAVGGSIKLVETALSTVRVPNPGGEEQRYTTYDVVLKATDY